MKKIHFTPGPSEVYFTVEEHVKNAFKHQIPSITHRGSEFISLYRETVENIRTLLNLPDNFQIAFTTSATEVWERMSENLIEEHSYHLVNGDFSGKFHKAAKAIGKNAIANMAAPGTCANVNELTIPDEVELIGLAQNETSTGAALPLEDIYTLRKNNPEKLLVVDAVSSLPVIDLDFSQVDSVYCSVQKCFGLPAGLGVWIYNEKCLEKAGQLKVKGKYHDTYHSLLNLEKFTKKHQTPCTPNVLGIYLLGKVVGDMLHKGIDVIRRESNYKSALLYNLFESHDQLNPFVSEKRFRSLTVGVAEVKGDSSKLIKRLSDQGMETGSGYGEFKNSHIRIANFPTHSKEQIEMLVDTVSSSEF
ncbi:aminotransferase class V-fold PLP-dependent enzyme [Reichenbachiella sp. MALMAid0571]|uniref:aminotransferase class V-fold PLP-dependent enzyme n=1 Tax=Reichenbachiella sp. MALMAid0571 TaxID=3143939 RepID=UPI0032DF0DB5